MSQQIYQARLEKAYRNLKKRGLTHAIVGSPANMYYLTGKYIAPYERYYGLTLNAEEKKAVMVAPSLDRGCMGGLLPEITYEDIDGPQEAIAASLGNVKSLAVEKNYYTMATGEIFAKICPQIENLGDCMMRLRYNKDESELANMQRAAEMVDDTFAFIKSKIRPGMTEKEVNALMYQHMKEMPDFMDEESIILVQGGENTANPHGTSGTYVLKENDVVLFDFCAVKERYWSDMTRCLFLGNAPDPKLMELYEIVLRANQAAIAAVRPGVRACEIDQAARDVIETAGYGPYFLHRTGHGLGLSVHEEPFITGANELILEAGMTFTIEPGIYLEKIGGIRIEDDVLVTEEGCRVLTSTPKSIKEAFCVTT